METFLSYVVSTYVAIGFVLSMIVAANIKATEARFFKREHVIIYIIFPFSIALVCISYIALGVLTKTLDWITD